MESGWNAGSKAENRPLPTILNHTFLDMRQQEVLDSRQKLIKKTNQTACRRKISERLQAMRAVQAEEGSAEACRVPVGGAQTTAWSVFPKAGVSQESVPVRPSGLSTQLVVVGRWRRRRRQNGHRDQFSCGDISPCVLIKKPHVYRANILGTRCFCPVGSKV